MSLLYCDGFSHYATADLAKKGWTAAGTAAAGIGATSGRRSGGGLLCPASGASNSTSHVTRTFAAAATWIIGVAFKIGAAPNASATVISLFDAGVEQVDVRYKIDGTLVVTRDGTALTSGTSAVSLTPGIEYYIEFKVTIANSISAGTCKVRLNGVDIITVATSQDTQNTANATANQVRLGSSIGNSLNATSIMTFSDLYICDSAGSTNNDFLGDSRVDTIFPTSDGNYSQFTCSTGSSHFALVDEASVNTSDYNDGGTVNDRDSYGMGNLSALASQTVYGLQVNAACLKDDAGAKSAATFVRSNSTNGDGASAALGTSQSFISQIFETNPDGSVAWTETTVNAMEAGVLVTA